jgi:hypothetical protein
MLVFVLCAYDSANHQDFHENYVADEGNLSQSMLQGNIHTNRNRTMSHISFHERTFKLKLMDQIVSKKDDSGNESYYFMIEVQSAGMIISKVEKSYADIQSLEVALEYGLRGTGIDPPKLGQADIMDQLIANSGALFKYYYFSSYST